MMEIKQLTRQEIADELERDMDSFEDFDNKKTARAIRAGASKEEILAMPEVSRWPEKYVWLKVVL